MLRTILNQRIKGKDYRGIIFDQRYTDSALKILAPKSYARHEKWGATQPALPEQEILTSLLLFGKAYFSPPSWLTESNFPELSRLISEDLIEWIPENVLENSFKHLGLLISKMRDLGVLRSEVDMVRFSPSGSFLVEDFNRRQSEKSLLESELAHDIQFILRNLFYTSPLITGNLEFLKFSRLVDPLSVLSTAVEMPAVIPASAFTDSSSFLTFQDILNQNNASILGHTKLFPFSPTPYYGELGDDDEREDFREYCEDLESDLATILDAAISSFTAETFAAATSLPIKSNGKKGVNPVSGYYGPEAYQLIKVQFKELRYPVIQSVDDVLRLRNDPHINNYRMVIAEYSGRIREELERERPKILRQFREDMKLALSSLKVVKRWSKIVDLSFYVSIPLSIIGTLSGFPLSDILLIPLTAYAKVVSHKKRKELDWILFGRS